MAFICTLSNIIHPRILIFFPTSDIKFSFLCFISSGPCCAYQLQQNRCNRKMQRRGRELESHLYCSSLKLRWLSTLYHDVVYAHTNTHRNINQFNSRRNSFYAICIWFADGTFEKVRSRCNAAWKSSSKTKMNNKIY